MPVAPIHSNTNCVFVIAAAPAFDPMVALSRAAMDAGAAGVMIAPPATVKHAEQFVAC